MPAQLVENIQYFDSDGLPLVGASIYFGTTGLEPIGNLISIFSDSDLTVSISNPQTTGSTGFSGNKVYVSGKYSLRINTVLAVQFLLDLNAGSTTGTGTTSLNTVLGTDAITASGVASVVTTLVDKEVYALKIANTNTGTSGVTLKIDSTDTLSIVKNFDQAIAPGDFTQNQIIRVQHNSTSNNFAWVDASVKTKRLTKGSDIATATSITVPDNDGNVIDLTGSATVATINGVAGTEYTFQTDSTPTFTNSASLVIEGAVDYTAAAGDVFRVYMFTGSTCRLYNISKADGTSAIQSAGESVQVVNTQTGAVATGTTIVPFDDTIPQITDGDEFMTRTITPTNSSNLLKIEVLGFFGVSIANNFAMSLFQDSTADALATGIETGSTVDSIIGVSFIHFMTAGTTSLTTFRMRAGGGLAGTTTFNGNTETRRFGGVLASSITITEIIVMLDVRSNKLSIPFRR